jgi:hypothetical protein
MITASDRGYKATKRIKQGKKRLAALFDELAEWIGAKWNVTVLNVQYDRANSLHAPRVQVVFEYESEARRFHRGVNFDMEKQEAVAEKFLEIGGRDPKHTFDVDGLFVIFSAFAPVARQEADSQISDEEVQALKERIGNPDIWEIFRCFGHVTFFFFTDGQVKRHEADGKKKEYAKRYFGILKSYDEFDYLKESEFKIDFDSKENFDENYNGSWFNYYH